MLVHFQSRGMTTISRLYSEEYGRGGQVEMAQFIDPEEGIVIELFGFK